MAPHGWGIQVANTLGDRFVAQTSKLIGTQFRVLPHICLAYLLLQQSFGFCHQHLESVDHAMLETPVPIQTLKLGNIGPV